MAKRTLESVAENLVCSDDLWLHIADDGSSQDYRDSLWEIAHRFYGDNVSISNSERNGYGGNYNTATQVIHHITDIILPLEDDWELARLLDIDPIVKVLRDGHFDCVRMGYIGYTAELRGTLRYHEGIHWLEFDPTSSERHVFAGGPRLETVEFERRVGPWNEKMEQGLTEFEVSGRDESRKGVAWPVDLIRLTGDAFVHIGTYPAGEEQVDSETLVEAG